MISPIAKDVVIPLLQLAKAERGSSKTISLVVLKSSSTKPNAKIHFIPSQSKILGDKSPLTMNLMLAAPPESRVLRQTWQKALSNDVVVVSHEVSPGDLGVCALKLTYSVVSRCSAPARPPRHRLTNQLHHVLRWAGQTRRKSCHWYYHAPLLPPTSI